MTTERHILLREFRPNSIRIKLHSAIGEGLSANVFRGVREDSRGFVQQHVAVKITKSAGEAGCLRREFETLLQVQSPHLVRVFAWDDHGDQSMLSMEYIDGVALSQLVSSCLLDERGVEEIITQVQEGLRALAAKNLEHGDLSPGNILIDRQGVVKLIDFANPERGSGIAHGTPPYMAPEVWSGEAPTIKSDLFALALLQHDLLAKVRDADHAPPVDKPFAQARCFSFCDFDNGDPWLANSSHLRRFTPRNSCPQARADLMELVNKIAPLPSTAVRSASACAPTAAITLVDPSQLGAIPRLGNGEQVFTSAFSQKFALKRPKYGVKMGGFRSLHQHRGVIAAMIFFVVSCASGRDGRGVGSMATEKLGELLGSKAESVTPSLPLGKALSEDFTSDQRQQKILSPSKSTGGSLRIQSHRWMHFAIGSKDLGYAPIAIAHLKPGKYRLKWISSAASGVKTIEIRAAHAIRLNENDFKVSRALAGRDRT